MALLDLQGLEPPVDERGGGKNGNGGNGGKSGGSKGCGPHSSTSLTLCFGVI